MRLISWVRRPFLVLHRMCRRPSDKALLFGTSYASPAISGLPRGKAHQGREPGVALKLMTLGTRLELLYSWLQRQRITTQDLFDLHNAVQVVQVSGIFKPTGAWKREPNGTDAVTSDGDQVFIEYAKVPDVPLLMGEWLEKWNQLTQATLSLDEGIEAYATLHIGFVHIHPFWDGNGRLARLLSNLPLLRSGHLPLIISRLHRKEYIDLLTEHHLGMGQLSKSVGFWPDTSLDRPFADFCHQEYRETIALFKKASLHQEGRDQRTGDSPVSSD